MEKNSNVTYDHTLAFPERDSSAASDERPSGRYGEDKEQASITIAAVANVDDTSHPPPDGGKRGWLVVLGASSAFFPSWGIANGYGVFHSYYSSTLLKTSSSSTISLIGSMQLALIYGLGPIIGRIVDAQGASVVVILGTILVFVSLMLLSVCTELYQVVLTHGILFGIGSALLFTPSLTCIGQHFTTKRAFAMSMAGAFSALGGAAFPILIQTLVPRIGFPWAVRVLAFTTLPFLLVSCLTLKNWLPPSKDLSLRTAIDLKGFKDLRYTLAAAGSFLIFLVLFIPFFYIEMYADAHHVSSKISRYLVTIMNACGIPAKIIPGRLADRFGVLPVLIPSLLISAALVLGLWMPSRSAAAIIAFTCLYGLFCGAFTTLLPPYIASIVPREKFGARLGSVYIGVAIANLVGPTAAGNFIHKSSSVTQAEFEKLIIFTGIAMAAGSLLCGCAHFVRPNPLHKGETTA